MGKHDKSAKKSHKKHGHKDSKKREHKDSKKKHRKAASSSSSSGSESPSHPVKYRKRQREDSDNGDAATKVSHVAGVATPADVKLEELPLAARLLVELLTDFPDLPPELADMFNVLDGGQTVHLDGVSDEALRHKLGLFLESMGLLGPGPGGGAMAYVAPPELAGELLRSLAGVLDDNRLAVAPRLDPAHALRSAQALIEDMCAREGMEGIRGEVPVLLGQVLAGELVVVEGLPDEALRDFLAGLFGALGLQERAVPSEGEGGSTDMGWGLPATNGGASESMVRELILANGGDLPDSPGGTSAPPSGHVSSDEEEPAGPKPRRGPLGPAMPPKEYLEAAQRMAAQLGDHPGDASSEEEGELGPVSVDKATRLAAESDDPLPPTRQKKLERAAEWEKVTGHKTGAAKALRKAEEEGKGGREEWMLVPPKSLGILGAVKTHKLESRKFQLHSQRGARAGIGQPDAPKSLAELQAEAAAEAVLAEHKKLRGPSLAEMHAESAAHKKHAGGGKPQQWNWTRDGDFNVSHQRVNHKDYADMVNKAKELDTKFSRAVQRNFL